MTAKNAPHYTEFSIESRVWKERNRLRALGRFPAAVVFSRPGYDELVRTMAVPCEGVMEGGRVAVLHGLDVLFDNDQAEPFRVVTK